MRLSFVCHEFPPIGGGAATALDALTHELAVRGHDVSILTIGLSNQPPGTMQDHDGRRITRLSAGRKTLLAPSIVELLHSCWVLRKHMFSWLSEQEPDLIVAYFAVPAGYLALRPAQCLNKPLVVSLRGSDLPGFSKQRLGVFAGLQSYFLGKVWRHADLLCANGDALCQLAKSFQATDKLHNLPNGVDIAKFYPAERAPDDVVSRILFVGQLIARKRCVEILEGVALASRICGPLEITFAGDGPLRQQLKEMRASLPAACRVNLPGLQPRESLGDMYRRHEVLIQVSKAEGVSNVVLEALASGLPILGSTAALGSGASAEPICPGVLLDPVTPQAICDAIVRIHRDNALREKLIVAARAYALTHSWSAKAQEFEALMCKTFGG